MPRKLKQAKPEPHYYSPSGRLCRIASRDLDTGELSLEYLDVTGQRVAADGFTLSVDNFHHLKRADDHAPAR